MIRGTIGFDACDTNGATLTFDIPANLPSSGNFDNIFPGANGSGSAAGKWNGLGTQMFTRVFDAQPQWSVGFNLMPFYSEGLGTLWARDQFLVLASESGVQMALELQTDGSIAVVQGGNGTTGSGSIVNRTSVSFAVGAWSGYIELFVTGLGGSATVEIWVNDVQVCLCPVLTTTTVDRFSIGSQNGPPTIGYFGLVFDNFTFADGQGAAPFNTRLGPCRVTTMLPISDASGTWFQTVNGVLTPAPIYPSVTDDPDIHGSPDYDYSTISPTALNAGQYFLFQKAACYGRVLGVVVNICLYPGPNGLALVSAEMLQQSTLTYINQIISSLTYFKTYQFIQELSPGTGTYFTDAEIAGSFWGVSTSTAGVLVTQMYLEKIVSLRATPFNCGQNSYSF